MPDWEPYPTLPVFTWGIKRADNTHKKGRLLKQAAFLWVLHRFFGGYDLFNPSLFIDTRFCPGKKRVFI